ncbi:MAG: L,D-transpeptidase family protein, partial [Gemmatimonadaceae bacterium]
MIALILASFLAADTSGAVRAAERPRTTPAPSVADRVVVEKQAHRLTLYHGGRAIRTYYVALGASPVGDKQRAGDDRTPEGVYTIDSRVERSQFHLALHISYPDAAHRARAAKRGESPGGDVMIHGLPPKFSFIGAAHRNMDWTAGCIAVTDEEIEEIWRAVPNGTKIEIRP